MESDPETKLAYYCWVNRGWTPSQFASLSKREKVLVALFAKQESKAREEINGRRR